MHFSNVVLCILLFGFGVGTPLVGIVSLLRREQNHSSVSLILVNVSTVIFNWAYSAMLLTNNLKEATLALDITYIANAMYMIFFILFVIHYTRTRRLRIMLYIWSAIEVAFIFIVTLRDGYGLIRGSLLYSFENPFKLYLFKYNQGILLELRYIFLSVILAIGLFLAFLRYCQTNLRREKKNYAKLLIAESLLLLGCLFKIFFNWFLDPMPFLMAAAVLIINIAILRGHFFRATDTGREWVFSNLDHAFIIVDSSYRFLDCNKEAEKVFPELKNCQIERIVPTEVLKFFRKNEEEILSSKEMGTINYKDRIYTRIIMDMEEDGVIEGHVIILNDITERIMLMHRLQEEKERADEANRAKSTFLSTISHEIRTPMNAIVGITDIMLRKRRNQQDTEYLMNIRNSGEALTMIINDILDYSKIEAGQMTVINDEYTPAIVLNDLKVIFMTRLGSKPVELIYDIMEDLPGKLYGDSIRIRQIIINLVNNAIKFTEKGYVKLSIKAIEEEDDEIKLMISVEDTGVGIKDLDQSRLFDAFSQVDEKKNHSKEGTGLGLAICKQLVELMGGEIGVESMYGLGSRFWFTLPQKVISREPVKVLEFKNEDDFDFECPEVRALLVDDNDLNLKVAIGLLEPLHMQIETAHNGKKAVEKIQANYYDLVFMDHMMPVMDGVEATKVIRKLEDDYFKKLPIIALTANVTNEAQAEFEEAGMNSFLAKPIKMKNVLRELRKLLPVDKIIPITRIQEEEEELYAPDDYALNEVNEEMKGNAGSKEDIPVIEGLNVEAGIENCGTKKLFLDLLADFYKYIDIKSNKIVKCLADGLIRDYTIEVHALKNTARMIGALELSDEFFNLEKLGNAENVEEITKLTPGVIDHLMSYKPVLEPFAKSSNENKEEVSKDVIMGSLQKLYDAMDGFDLDGADEAIEELGKYKLPANIAERLNELEAMVADVEIENTMSLSKELMDVLK